MTALYFQSRAGSEPPSPTQSSMGRGANAWREKRASSIDLDEARDEIEYTLDCAEDELSSGDPTRGEQTLYSCFTRCTELGRPFDLYRLLIAIRLGDLFFRDGFWAKAVEQYQVAYQIWDLDEHIADHEPRLHPISFLPKVAECYERAGSIVAPKMKSKADQFVALYEDHWRNTD